MTSPERPVPKIRWSTIQRSADLGERSRLESLSKEELDQELRQGGIDPEEAIRRIRQALSITTNGTAPVNEAKLRVVVGEGAAVGKPARVGRSRVVWAEVTGWVAATAAAAAILLRIFFTGPELVGTARPPRPPDPAKLRAEAAAACDKQSWTECEQKLNEARRIDPDGEDDPRVIEERKAIAEQLR